MHWPTLGSRPGPSRPLAADAGEQPPVTHIYQHENGPARSGSASIPPDPGHAPAGGRRSRRARRRRRRAESTLAIDLAKAAPGRWQFRAIGREGPVPVVPRRRGGGDIRRTRADVDIRQDESALVPGAETSGSKKSTSATKTSSKAARALQIAVTKPQFDDMGKLLVRTGGRLSLYRDRRKMPSSRRQRWTRSTYSSSPAAVGLLSGDRPNESARARPGVTYAEMRPEIDRQIKRT